MNQIDKLKEFKQLLQDISDADNKHIMTMEAVNVIRSFIQNFTPKEEATKYKYSRKEMKQVFANLPYWANNSLTPEDGLKFVDMLLERKESKPKEEEIKCFKCLYPDQPEIHTYKKGCKLELKEEVKEIEKIDLVDITENVEGFKLFSIMFKAMEKKINQVIDVVNKLNKL